MFEKSLVMGLYSVTPVHAGSGAELSVIDLPIQRERHTGFPVIWGQSLKGVLRSSFRKLEMDRKLKINDKDWEKLANEIYKERADDYVKKVKEGKRDPPITEIIFGPSTEAASEHGGAISVGDAKILLFPVRSLKGVFAYVTCPLVLKRFIDDLIFALKTNGLSKYKDTINQVNTLLSSEDSQEKSTAVVFSDDVVIKKNGKKYVVLEDLLFNVPENKPNELEHLLNLITKIAPENVKKEIKGRFVIVSDDLFRALVETATEIVARVKIDAETGTVKTGALWYEEYLPSDTLLYSVIAVGEPRKKIEGLSTADKIISKLNTLNGKFVQIGGNETVGKGFVKLTIWGEENGSEKS
ncbi:MAG: hypothetical protein XD43_0035 [Thermococcales archaeon 44_46]|uniref:type III-B CRISPR module RAMP protein Cmr4 n=1 Tax=Thermococcus sp. PK TaxID=913025 RepID=UPI0005B287E2|nr:type III-B CRISPR module RAMP protein Cmr4 [Thermococcus sp. PK]KUK00288.1 MAG: hypothetical protein XD43_0035 [Thermococcales archaeon 44_46]MDK2782931.1 CRISPR-associated protein Cmr4 [Thermococcaceae archaeon]MDK2982633.1 CRISPR-associated protein Cmr4 [Thermococcaceae archaeon]HIH73373.1 type III-B CRISPR module RAMP protein Cmr4 [Thermococcaceae archaeon]